LRLCLVLDGLTTNLPILKPNRLVGHVWYVEENLYSLYNVGSVKFYARENVKALLLKIIEKGICTHNEVLNVN